MPGFFQRLSCQRIEGVLVGFRHSPEDVRGPHAVVRATDDTVEVRPEIYISNAVVRGLGHFDQRLRGHRVHRDGPSHARAAVEIAADDHAVAILFQGGAKFGIGIGLVEEKQIHHDDLCARIEEAVQDERIYTAPPREATLHELQRGRRFDLGKLDMIEARGCLINREKNDFRIHRGTLSDIRQYVIRGKFKIVQRFEVSLRDAHRQRADRADRDQRLAAVSAKRGFRRKSGRGHSGVRWIAVGPRCYAVLHTGAIY